MQQAEVEQWIREQGGHGRVQYQRSTQQVDNPAADPLAAKRAGVPFDATAPEKITVAEEKWVAVDEKGQPTGAALHVRRRPDGDFDIVDQANANPTKPGANATTPEAQNAAELQRQRERNAALPQSQDPAYETDEDRRKRSDARIAQQGRDAKAADDKARQDRLDQEAAAARTAQEQRAAAAESRAAAAANRVTPSTQNVTGSDGKAYTRVTTVSVDGATVTVKNFGPDGKEVGEIPGESKTGFGVEPEGAPPPTDAPGQVTQGLRVYSSWLSTRVKLYRDSGGQQGVSPEEATKLMDRRISLAEAAVKEQAGLTSSQSGIRTQDITQRRDTLGETQSRRTAAENAIKETDTALNPLLAHLPPSAAGAFVGAQQERLANALAYANQWGGMRESPEVGTDSFPALASARQAAMAGINTAASGGPLIFAPRPLTNPLPAPIFAPQPPATPPQNPGAAEATAQASIEQANGGRSSPPTAGEPGGPPLQPGPVLGGPAPALPIAANPIDNTPITAEPPARANLPSAAAPAPAGPPVLGKPGADPSFTGEPGQSGGTVLPQPPAAAPAPPPEPAPAPAGGEMVTVRSITGQTMQVPRSEWEAPWTPWKRPAPPIWQEVPPEAPAAPDVQPLPPNEMSKMLLNPAQAAGPVAPAPSPEQSQSILGRGLIGQGQQQGQPAPLFMQQQRYGQAFDPHAAAADLSERLGIDPAIMAQAIQGLYGR